MKKLLGLLGIGALGSQAGHLIAYQIQFGSAAPAMQSQGAHAYFPALARTSLGLTAGLLLVVLLVIGVARFASGRPIRARSSPALMSLLSVLFTVQLTVFIVQETIESVAAGAPAPHAVALMFLGTIGQLPVAALAALAIKWLATRFEVAVVSLRLNVLGPTLTILDEVVTFVARPTVVSRSALAEACPASFVKRGPPLILRG